MDIKSLMDRLAAIESAPLEEAGGRTAKNIINKVVNKASPNNPNAAFAELPGAAKPATDLTGGTGVTGAGSVGARRAQVAADNQLAAQRAASAQTAQDLQKALRPAEKAAADTATTASKAAKVAGNFKEKGALLANYIKTNPKLAAAIASAAAIYAGGSALQSNEPEQQVAATGTAPTTTGTNNQEQGAQAAQLDALKKQIDALIAELEPSKDQQVQKELARIKAKYAGSTEQGALPAKAPVANAFDIQRGKQ